MSGIEEMSCTLAYLRLQPCVLRLQLLFAAKAGFDNQQLRNRNGRWALDGGTTRVGRIDKTGHARIDARTELLVDVIREVVDREGPGSGSLYGIRIHRGSADVVRDLDPPGTDRTGVEQSFSAGDLVRYGLDGSVRTDIVMRAGRGTEGRILAVWDIKTGSARLSEARATEIRAALGIDRDVPVIEIHIARGIDMKRVHASVFSFG